MNALGISLTLTNEAGQVVDLYDDPDMAVTSTSGFGLDGEINTVTDYNNDGSTYVNTYIPARTLDFTIQYKDVPDPEAAKLRLHSILAPRQKIKIWLITPHVNSYIYGYCEKCETPPNDYPMTTSASIICPDPWWNSVDSEGLEVNIEGGEGDIYYSGTVPTGFITELHFTSNAVWAKISVNNKLFVSDNSISGGNGWTDTIQSYNNGSKLIIDSVSGEKAVKYYTNPDSDKYVERFTTTQVGLLYPVLNPGNNHIKITSDGTFTAKIKFSVKSEAV